jgi:hypothetical protein
MLKLLTTAIVLALAQVGLSQGWQPVGARSLSLGSASVALSDDAWSYHHNPGALAQLERTAVGVSYENRYLLKELQTQGLVLVHPMKKGVISVGAQLYGYQAYRTTRIGAGYSMALAARLYAGVQLNYGQLRIERYGTKNTVTAEFGLLAVINKQLSLGCSIFNLGRNRLNAYQDERFSTCMRLGLMYKVSEKVKTLLEMMQETGKPLRLKCALEYGISEQVNFRAGSAFNPLEIAFGCGYRLKNNLQLDLGSSWQQVPGWSPHIGLTFVLQQKADA